MPLEFGLIKNNLFQNSNISGVGLSGNPNQAVLNENIVEGYPAAIETNFAADPGTATGTMTDVAEANSTDTLNDQAFADTIGDYADIPSNSSVVYRIKQWAFCGDNGNNQNAIFSLYYWNVSTNQWVLWVGSTVQYPEGHTALGFNYKTVNTVITNKVRIMTNVVDTGDKSVNFRVKY